jgi:uncharacterized OB-fold protein
MVTDPLHRLDCCVVTDGGGALVVVAPEVARDLDRAAVKLLAHGEAPKHTANGRIDLTYTGAAWSGPRAFAEAGVTPADIDYASIYGSFTITVLESLEDLGFCAKGDGGRMSGSLPAPAPRVNPEAKSYCDATADGRLLLPRCTDCGMVIWYTRGFCPECSGRAIDWCRASGRGVVYSYTVNRRGVGPYAEAGAYVIAYVELEEGPRVLTNIVDADFERLAVGDAVEAVFHDTGEGTALVRFRPVAA